MTYVGNSNETKNPFATSTSYNGRGPLSFNEDWITVTGTAPPVATIVGTGISVSGVVGNARAGRIYYNGRNHLETSAHAYWTTNQVDCSSIDECICAGNSFSLVRAQGPWPTMLDVNNSRTHIFKVGF